MATRDGQDEDGDTRGLKGIARSILDHGADYAEARIDLAKLEADEAGKHFRGLSIRLAVGAFAATVGYAFTIVAAIGLLARYQFDGHWELPTLIAGGIHLFIGLLFLLGARRQARLSSKLFSSTRRELKKDQQWLKQKSPPEE